MNTTLLVLLVGELLTPFPAELKAALPQAFPDHPPELGVGATAPPGRNVAWISLSADGQQLDVVLHTARVPGDLRRSLRFAPEDSVADRARAAAFTLAAMVRQRDEDLRALEPRSVLRQRRPWELDVSGFFGLDVPNLHVGGGGGVRLQRELGGPLSLGLGIETGGFSGPQSAMVAPSVFGELGLRFAVGGGTHSAGVTVGGGVMAPVLIRDGKDLTTWLPLLRVALEARLRLTSDGSLRHGVRLAVAGHFVPFRLAVQAGETPLGTVGPAWIRPEIGYFVEL